jgi:hypothetical protein
MSSSDRNRRVLDVMSSSDRHRRVLDVMSSSDRNRRVLEVMGPSAIGGARWKRSVDNPPVHPSRRPGVTGAAPDGD